MGERIVKSPVPVEQPENEGETPFNDVISPFGEVKKPELALGCLTGLVGSIDDARGSGNPYISQLVKAVSEDCNQLKRS